MAKTYKYNRRRVNSSLGVIENTPENRKIVRRTNKDLAKAGCTFRLNCRFRGPQALRSSSGEALAKTAPLMAIYIKTEGGTLSTNSLRHMGLVMYNLEQFIVG